MDIDGILDDSTVSGNELVITPAIRDFLSQSARWGKFLAIVGMVFIGLGILMFVFFGAAIISLYSEFPGMSGAGGSFVLFTSVLGMVMAIIPILYLYRFSSKLQVALRDQNQEVLTDAFQNHKSLFKFYGVLMAIVLGFYALMLVIGLLAGLGGALAS